MKAINLLPPEKKPSGAVLGASKILKELATVSVVIFFVAVSVFITIYFVMSGKLKSQVNKEKDLVSQVKSLQQAEQSLVLVKDRLSKISKITAINDASREILLINQIDKSLPSGVRLLSSSLSPGNLEINIMTDNSANLSRFLTQLINSDFSKLELTSFSYDPDNGYQVGIGIVK